MQVRYCMGTGTTLITLNLNTHQNHLLFYYCVSEQYG